MRITVLIAGIISLFLASCNVASTSRVSDGRAIEYAASKGLTNVRAHPIMINDSGFICPVSDAGVVISSDQGPAVVCFTEEYRPFIPQTFNAEPSQ